MSQDCLYSSQEARDVITRTGYPRGVSQTCKRHLPAQSLHSLSNPEDGSTPSIRASSKSYVRYTALPLTPTAHRSYMSARFAFCLGALSTTSKSSYGVTGGGMCRLGAPSA